ncbi:MAG: phosphoglycolate phosphatase Gph [Idiomarinaceae bacterium HL-53]|nr:MAG: phosphoglycolate phosphatase Gph [Idiomarinaceae bacterium HL-53]CUS48922.1 phosphoglycolate phosphatase [Idiomarinaceae bacterium HL-53]
MKDSTPVQAVLFDLDGTLLDTAHDLGAALNTMLTARQRPALAHDIIRPLASHGSRGLLQRGFGDEFNARTQDQLREEFLHHYEQLLLAKTALFEGIQGMLENLHQRNVHTGIVTNKPHKYTQAVLAGFPILLNMRAIVSGDTLPVAKPDPAPILLAAEQLGVAPEHCLYLGDAQRDIEAGKRAQMRTVLVNWGYFSEDEKPELWGADYRIDHPTDLFSLLD